MATTHPVSLRRSPLPPRRNTGITSLGMGLLVALACLLGFVPGGPAIAKAADPAPGGVAATQPAANERADGPTLVSIGFHILSIRSVDLPAQSMFADFYMWVRFKPASQEQEKEIIDKIEFMNGKPDTKDEVENKKIGEETYVCWRIAGTFNFNVRLQNYPFDTQTLEILVENSNLESDEMVFAADTESYRRGGTSDQLWGAGEDLAVHEYSLKAVTHGVTLHPYKSDFGDISHGSRAATTHSRYVMGVVFQRDYKPYVYKILLPIFVILAMSYVVFFLPAKEFATSAGIAITAILSCIAFNVAVAQTMPNVGYLVTSDKFFIGTYLLLLLTLVESIVSYAINNAGKAELAVKIDRVGTVVFPLLCVVMFAWLALNASHA